MQTVLVGSHFSQTVVFAGSKSLRTVYTEAKYDGQSQQKAKIVILVYKVRNLCHDHELIMVNYPMFQKKIISDQGRK